MATASLHLLRTQSHLGWNRDFEPVLSVRSGSKLTVETQDASGGQLGPGSTSQSVAELDFARVNPVCGPVFVEAAHPGDVLQVDILDVEPESYGWTAVVPGFGLLTDQFPNA